MRYRLPFQCTRINNLVTVASRVFKTNPVKNRFGQIALFFIFAIGILTVPLSPTVNAASVYDNIITTTNTLEIQNMDTLAYQDLTLNWYERTSSALEKSCLYHGGAWCSAKDVFAEIPTETSNVAVMQENWNLIEMWYTDDENASCQFVTESGDYQMKCSSSASNIYRVYLTNNGNCHNTTIRDGHCNFIQQQTPYGYSSIRAYETDTREWFLNTFPTNYPYSSGYEGEEIEDGSSDNDGDGLSMVQELHQGTSDGEIDTDSDGIDDHTESEWFPDRDKVFCDTSTPKVCAYPDPNKQDVYLEIDWMKNGSEIYKPNPTLLDTIEDAYASQNINFHADTGNFGGGNELQSFQQILSMDSSSTSTDFDEFKLGYGPFSANFSSDRQNIWHYMISGYKYEEDQDSSGIAEVGGDDLFISYGLIEDDFSYSNFDTYIASTIIHELGHNLCLTSNANLTYVPSECHFEGIDSDSIQYLAYPSAMTYIYQGATVDYSLGQNLVYDHDDWSAVKLGIDTFSGIGTSPGISNTNSGKEVKLAFELDKAEPNEMTPEKSQEVLELQQEQGIAPDASNPESGNSTQSSSAPEDEESLNSDASNGFDIEGSYPNELTPDQSERMNTLRQAAPYAAVLLGAGAIYGTYLLIKRSRNKTSNASVQKKTKRAKK